MAHLLQYLYRLLEAQLDETNIADQSELSQTVEEDSDSEAAEDERNFRDFLAFETKRRLLDGLSLPGAPNGEEVVSEEVKAQLRFFDEQLPASPPQETRCRACTNQLTRIQIAYPDFLDAEGGSALSDASGDGMNGGYLGAYRYANHVASHGQRKGHFRRPFVPATSERFSEAVSRFTAFNVSLEERDAEESFECQWEPSAEHHANTPIQRCGEDLYNLLAKRPDDCLSRDHRALLQLSEVEEGSTANVKDHTCFHMFLSTCPGEDTEEGRQEWHKTTCSMTNSSNNNNGSNNGIDICQQVRVHQDNWLPLFLTLSQTRLWFDLQPTADRHEPHGKTPQMTLSKFLDGGDLGTTDVDPFRLSAITLKKAQLALHLATYLCQLYPGPWLPQDWTAEQIYFLSDQRNAKFEEIYPPLVLCTLREDWRNGSTVFKHSQQTLSTCPPFFLSFAQLLLDLEKGSQKTDARRAAKAWQSEIHNEVKQTFKDPMFESYRMAIKGCLHFSLDFSLARTKDLTRRAQTVIHNNIVRHLRLNQTVWEQEMKRQGQAILMARASSDKQSDWNDLTHKTQSYQAPEPCMQLSKAPTTKIRPKIFKSGLPETRETNPYFVPGELMLFDDGKETYKESTTVDPDTQKFVDLMDDFKYYIECLDELDKSGTTEPQKRPIRIAVLDTGIHIHETDELLQGGKNRIVMTRSFIGKEDQHQDSHGHGTHVVRLLLRFAPNAEIVVAKVSEDKLFKTTQMSQIVKALEWVGGADCDADIITMSFGFRIDIPGISAVIDDLVGKDKLIFAAASNGGGNGTRAYPARNDGVFAIHAAKGSGERSSMNPPKMFGDNFSTLGVAIDSQWLGKELSISGTSFATPVAAAIAANVLEFTRCTLTEPGDKPYFFHSFHNMGVLFRCLKDEVYEYDYVKPWQVGYWEKLKDERQFWKVCDNLRYIIKYGKRKRETE